MRLVTFEPAERAAERPRLGALVADEVLEFDARHPPFASMLALIEAGPAAWEEAAAQTEAARGRLWPASAVRLLAPLPLPPQMRDAMMFHEHIRRSKAGAMVLLAERQGRLLTLEEAMEDVVAEVHRQRPVYYKANRFAVSGPEQVIGFPHYSRLWDFELELACIVGRTLRDATPAAAEAAIFGYTIFNDLSARDAQLDEMSGSLGPAKGKDWDGANVLGPCIVTADELGNPYGLRMEARVNGELWCCASSDSMNWTFGDLLARVSAAETVHPGEVLGSGTVGGGCGLEFLRFLSTGDVVELEIERIGVLRTIIGPRQPEPAL